MGEKAFQTEGTGGDEALRQEADLSVPETASSLNNSRRVNKRKSGRMEGQRGTGGPGPEGILGHCIVPG